MKKWANNKTYSKKKNRKKYLQLYINILPFKFVLCLNFGWVCSFYYRPGIWTFSTNIYEKFSTLSSDISRSFLGLNRDLIPWFILKLSFEIPVSKSAFPVSNFTINNKFSFLNNNFNRTGNFPSEKLLFSTAAYLLLLFFFMFSTQKNYSTKNPTKKTKQSNFNWVEEIHCVLWLATNNINFSAAILGNACSWQQQYAWNKYESQFLVIPLCS